MARSCGLPVSDWLWERKYRLLKIKYASTARTLQGFLIVKQLMLHCDLLFFNLYFSIIILKTAFIKY